MAYVLSGEKWGSGGYGSGGGQVTWSFATVNYAGQIHAMDTQVGPEFQTVIRTAFARWESVLNVDFVEVSDAPGNNIRLGFDYIDGSGPVAGQESDRSTGSGPAHFTQAAIWFETDENWTRTATGIAASGGRGVDFYAVALHEIGHAIGLGHAEGEPLVMNATSLNTTHDLYAGDIAGGQAIYGAHVFVPPPSPPTPGIVLVGGPGNDWLNGSAGDDKMNGAGGNDILIGNAGNDELGGGSGDDVIVGGDGNDTGFGEDGNDRINLGNGNDIGIGGNGDDELGGGAGDDVLVGNAGADTLFGESGDDRMNGGTGNDILLGGSGNDELGGGEGNDVIIGEDGNDSLFGELGDDRMNGGAGNDILLGSDGNDELGGGLGNDDLQGGWGNDVLFGEAGIDFLTGGVNDDILIGGADGDFFVFASGHMNDTIVDFQVGLDHILLQGLGATITQAGPNTIIFTGSGSIALLNVSPNSLPSDAILFR